MVHECLGQVREEVKFYHASAIATERGETNRDSFSFGSFFLVEQEIVADTGRTPFETDGPSLNARDDAGRR